MGVRKECRVFGQNAQSVFGQTSSPGLLLFWRQNAQSGGVITMIQQIIDDAEAMEKEAIRDETDAQVIQGPAKTETYW